MEHQQFVGAWQMKAEAANLWLTIRTLGTKMKFLSVSEANKLVA